MLEGMKESIKCYKRSCWRGWVTLSVSENSLLFPCQLHTFFPCSIHMNSKYLTSQLLTGDLATNGGESDSSSGGETRVNPLLTQVKGCVNAFQWNQTCFGKTTFAPTEVKQNGIYCGSLVTVWLTYLLPQQRERSGLWWSEDEWHGLCPHAFARFTSSLGLNTYLRHTFSYGWNTLVLVLSKIWRVRFKSDILSGCVM